MLSLAQLLPSMRITRIILFEKNSATFEAHPFFSVSDDAGSGNEEELIDEDQSTTSSVVGQTTGYRVHPPMLRMGEKSYRPPKRFHYNRFRSNEPLIKLESKTFDEGEFPVKFFSGWMIYYICYLGRKIKPAIRFGSKKRITWARHYIFAAPATLHT